jgi:hypothetical protein
MSAWNVPLTFVPPTLLAKRSSSVVISPQSTEQTFENAPLDERANGLSRPGRHGHSRPRLRRRGVGPVVRRPATLRTFVEYQFQGQRGDLLVQPLAARPLDGGRAAPSDHPALDG